MDGCSSPSGLDSSSIPKKEKKGEKNWQRFFDIRSLELTFSYLEK